MSDESMKEFMAGAGLEWTRENYIWANFGNETPDPWTAEDEGELPDDLQDWSLFERVGNKLVLKAS